MVKKSECTLTCPKCHKAWGKLNYDYDSCVVADDITITAGKKKKFKDGDELECVLCSHPYTNYDIMLNISESGGKGG